MSDLSDLTAVEAGDAIRRNVITSEELVRTLLSRIRSRDAHVHAWAHVDEALALDAARAADRRLREKGSIGPLHGVPVGIKDIVDTADLPTECGTPVFAGRRPTRDAAVVANLRAAGAVILGKTVTAELAFYGPGATTNPLDPRRTPGGSSSGSAAAVADRHVPIAIGTQTAGSIIRPASYCGILGYKPSFGIVPTEGVLSQSPPLDTVGGFARSVADLARLVGAMSPEHRAALAAYRGCAVARPRLAFLRTRAWDEVERPTQEAMLALAARHQDMIEPVTMPELPDEPGVLQRKVQFRDIAGAYGPIVEAHPDKVTSKLKETVAFGRTVEARDYEAALAAREQVHATLAPLLSRFDAILTPAASGPAPMGLSSTGSPVMNFLWTYLGMPGVSLPLLEVEGMPVGLQLVAARGDDAKLLATAEAAIALLTDARGTKRSSDRSA